MPLVEYWKLVVLQRYAKFDGRASRAEYWWFYLANFIVLFVLAALGRVSSLLFVLYVVYALALIVPTLAVAVRRLHDTGKSGWWLLIGLIPLAGFIILIVFLAMAGNPGMNQYGPPPPPGA